MNATDQTTLDLGDPTETAAVAAASGAAAVADPPPTEPLFTDPASAEPLFTDQPPSPKSRPADP
ncbi:MAG: hypothetical protein LBL92_02565, partial [Propionibacteriaceae bacterium]|nr:hypothetical protein [Propionibacteriaceae bacterium]